MACLGGWPDWLPYQRDLELRPPGHHGVVLMH